LEGELRAAERSDALLNAAGINGDIAWRVILNPIENLLREPRGRQKIN
jgi:hypothetical protein